MHRAAAYGLKAPFRESGLMVGCVIVDEKNKTVAHGFSLEKNHAEAAALSVLPKALSPENLTLFSTVEPCGKRMTPGCPTCASLIIKSGIKKVFYAMHEPSGHFVDQQNGVIQMREAGITVSHLSDETIIARVKRANPHIAWA